MSQENVIPERVAQWMPHARAAELVYGVDALDLLAIMDRESCGGETLYPRGPGGKGDNGNGHGLMQIDGRYHSTFLAALGPDGKPLWKDPAFNILYGAKLLHFNIHLFNGPAGVSPRLAGIAAYNAAPKRIREVLRGLTKPATEASVIAALDPLTTPPKPGEPGNYLSDVLARRKSYVITT